MSSSLLEVLRINHEQSERYEVAIGDELDQRPNGVSPCLVLFLISVLYSSHLVILNTSH